MQPGVRAVCVCVLSRRALADQFGARRSQGGEARTELSTAGPLHGGALRGRRGKEGAAPSLTSVCEIDEGGPTSFLFFSTLTLASL